jgi:hypothetical protein
MESGLYARRFQRLVDVLVISLLAAFTAVACARFWDWNFDDAYIVFRVVRNILDGNGWRYNTGETFNATTSPLNTILTALAARLTGDIPTAAHVLGGLWIFLTGWLIYALFRAEFGSLAGALSAAFMVHALSENMTWGLEINLFFFLLMAYAWLEHREKNAWPVVGLLVLARADGCLIVGIHVMRCLIKKRAGVIRGLLTVVGILTPWLVFSASYFNEILPHALHSKLWQGASGYWGTGWIYAWFLGKRLLLFTGPYRWELWAALVGAGFMIQQRSIWLLPVVFAVGQQAAYIAMNVPGQYHWYFGVFEGMLALSAAYGAYSLCRLIPASSRLLHIEQTGSRAADGLALAGLAAAICVWALWAFSGATRESDPKVRSYQAASQAVNAAQLDGRLAGLEVGALGYYTNRPIVDLCGLVSANPQYVSPDNVDQFYRDPPQALVLDDPPGHMLSALMSDRRFRETYDNGTRVVWTPMALRVYVRRAAGGEVVSRLHPAPGKIQQPEKVDLQ